MCLKGIFLSKDRGQSWNSLNYNLHDLQIQTFIINNGKLIVGTDSGIFKLLENQHEWIKIFDGVQVISFDTYEGEIVSGTNHGVLLSKNQGEEWNWIHKYGAVHNISVLNRKIVIMYISGDLFITNDRFSWIEVDYSPRIGSYIYDVVQLDSYLIMSNNYGLHHSIDEGKTWMLVYKTEEIAFYNFLVLDDIIYGGTRTWDEYRKRKYFD